MTEQILKGGEHIEAEEQVRVNVRGYKKGRGSLNTILPYHGEFMVNPVPLELSFNFCSHKCFYCFQQFKQPTPQVVQGANGKPPGPVQRAEHSPSHTVTTENASLRIQQGGPLCLKQL